MGDCLGAGKPSWYVTSRLGHLSLSCLLTGVKAGRVQLCRMAVTLCDFIRQVTLRGSGMGFY